MRTAAWLAAFGLIFATRAAHAGLVLTPFSVNFANATCDGGMVCQNNDLIDPFHMLAGEYFEVTTVPDNLYYFDGLGYGENNNASYITKITITSTCRYQNTCNPGIDLYAIKFSSLSDDDNPINIYLNGVLSTKIPVEVGPGGYLYYRYFVSGPSVTVGWTNSNVVGISAIAGFVPEPATWAIMLIGFFGLGGAMRMRRRRGAAPV